jgi:hypothetical protein
MPGFFGDSDESRKILRYEQNDQMYTLTDIINELNIKE